MKGIYSVPPQSRAHAILSKPASDVKKDKFFKARKLSHSKKRPGEKESMYEESMKLKIINNTLKEENMKMKTQIQAVEKELEKRDKLVEDVIMSLNKNLKCSE